MLDIFPMVDDLLISVKLHALSENLLFSVLCFKPSF